MSMSYSINIVMLKFCSQAYDTITIRENGDVYPCLCPAWHTYHPIGNVSSKSLHDVFNNNQHSKFQSTIIDQTFQYCKKDGCAKLWNLPTVENLTPPTLTLPTTLNLQLDLDCNLQCDMCRNHLIWSKKPNTIAEKILNQLIDDYKDFNKDVWVQCDTVGDVFVSTAYKNFFWRDDIPSCFQFNLSTNGNLITKSIDMIEKIKDQIFSVCVSLDAANIDTYKQVRGGKFEIVLEGLKVLKDIGIPRVTTSFVVQQRNHKEILPFYYLCKEYDVNYISYGEVAFGPHMTSEWWAKNQVRDNDLVDYNYLIDALKFVKNDPEVGLCGRLEYLIDSKKN